MPDARRAVAAIPIRRDGSSMLKYENHCSDMAPVCRGAKQNGNRTGNAGLMGNACFAGTPGVFLDLRHAPHDAIQDV
jgi:hypothetical protein